MRTGLRRRNPREQRCAQAVEAASQDIGKLPPWLKDAQDSVVVARLRRNLEARGDKPYLGNNAERVQSLVQDTSRGPEAESIAKRRAHCMKATERNVEIDTVDISGPVVGTTCAEQAETEADRLRMELSEVKGKLGNAEMAIMRLADELLKSKRELQIARDVALQLSLQMEAFANDMEGNSVAMESVARSVEMDLAAAHTELELVKAELAGKTSELNEIKPQLDFATTQLRIFQETYGPTYSQVKPAEMHAQQAHENLTIINANFGRAMVNLDVNQSTVVAPANPEQLLAELNARHSHADQPSKMEETKMETELEFASNARPAVLQDAW